MEIPCWKPVFTQLGAARRLPRGVRVSPEPPEALFYPYWAVALSASFRLPLAGPQRRQIPLCVDGLTGRVAILPGALEAEPRVVPDDRVLKPEVVLDEDRLAAVREAALPYVMRRLRVLATPVLEAGVAGLVYKQLMVWHARNGTADLSLYLDTLNGEWALVPRPALGAAGGAAPPQAGSGAGGTPPPPAGSRRGAAGRQV